MTPKEKAIELVEKNFLILSKRGEHHYTFDYAKRCALIAVDEIIIEYRVLMIETAFCYAQFKYWQEVKTEIKKL